MAVINFTKMHGLGNDFVVLDGVTQAFSLTPEQIRAIGDRHTGVGFDQLLVVAPATRDDCDFAYHVYNTDGSRAENCGNGSRCMISFIKSRGLSDRDDYHLDLINGSRLHCRANADGTVTTDMGAPVFTPADIPLLAESEQPTYDLTLADGTSLQVAALSMGNPHAVLVVADVDLAPVQTWGPLIEHHELFPNRVNAGFMQVVNPGIIRLRVFERGAGETLACGTGACAAVVAGIRQGLLDSQVNVLLPHGTLSIRWDGKTDGDDSHVLKTGPAATVFEGTLTL
jgi:diaminopimelate epimerase